MTTTPTPAPAQAAAAPDRITPAEMRHRLDEIDSRLDALTGAIATIADGLTHAASAAPVSTECNTMTIDSIIMTYDDKGQPSYKGKGLPYADYGVRIWAEVLPALGIDPATLKPGPNPQTPPIPARVLISDTTRKDGTTGRGPRKVIGKA